MGCCYKFYSLEQFYQEIAEKLDCHHQWVFKIVKDIIQNKSMIDMKVNDGGHINKLTEEFEEIIQEFYINNREALNIEVQSHLKEELGVGLELNQKLLEMKRY